MEVEESVPAADAAPTSATAVAQVSEEEQAANTRLKARALRFWLSIISQPATLHMYESTTVDGTLGAVDPSLELIQMSGLNTPMYRYEEALVRTSDIRYLVTKPCALRSAQEGEASSSSSSHSS